MLLAKAHPLEVVEDAAVALVEAVVEVVLQRVISVRWEVVVVGWVAVPMAGASADLQLEAMVSDSFL
jgi:hypothetical protein